MKPNETRIQSHILAQLSREPRCAVLMPDGRMLGAAQPDAIFWRQNTGAARAVACSFSICALSRIDLDYFGIWIDHSIRKGRAVARGAINGDAVHVKGQGPGKSVRWRGSELKPLKSRILSNARAFAGNPATVLKHIINSMPSINTICVRDIYKSG